MQSQKPKIQLGRSLLETINILWLPSRGTKLFKLDILPGRQGSGLLYSNNNNNPPINRCFAWYILILDKDIKCPKALGVTED